MGPRDPLRNDGWRHEAPGILWRETWAALQRGPFPIAGDYPDDYRAVLRIHRHSLDHLRRARIAGIRRCLMGSLVSA